MLRLISSCSLSFLCFLFYIELTAAKLPGGIESCKLNDPNLSGCIEKNTVKAIRSFKNGNKEINVGSIDPLHIDDLLLVRSKTSKNIALKFRFIKTDVYGISNTQFNSAKVKADGDHFELEADSFVPNVTLIGNYEITGQMLLLPLNAKDTFRLELYNYTSKGKLLLDSHLVDGVKYYKIKEGRVAMESIGGVKNSYANLVPGNKELSEKMNDVIQENFPTLLDLYKAPMNDFFSELFRQFADRVFSKIPAEQILIP